MDAFEQACIKLIVRHGLLKADVERQLPFVMVADRVHDAEGRRTMFRVMQDAPGIVPRDASAAADILVEAVGSVTVSLDIEDGFIRRLEADAPLAGWPAAPNVLGIAEYPEP